MPRRVSQVSVGYRLKFPRTKSEMLGVVDSYGNVKGIFERRLLTNVSAAVVAVVSAAAGSRAPSALSRVCVLERHGV